MPVDEGDEDREAETDDEDIAGSDHDLDLGDDETEEGLMLWNANHLSGANLLLRMWNSACSFLINLQPWV